MSWPRSGRDEVDPFRVAAAGPSMVPWALDLARMRAAAAWRTAQPRLGIDLFARGRDERTPSPQAALYVAFPEATLVMLEGRPGGVESPAYQPVVRDLRCILDALAHIRTMLAEHLEGRTLARFLPPIAPNATNRALKARAALASTFVAGLELAREGGWRWSREKISR